MDNLILSILLIHSSIINHVFSKNHLLDLNLFEEVLDPELCEEQLLYTSENALLAAQFLDAGIRIPKGILMGNFVDFGNYLQCLDIRQELPNQANIEGKYCMIDIPVDINLVSPELLGFQNINMGEELKEITVQRMIQINKIRSNLRLLIDGIGKRDSESLRITDTDVTLKVATCIPKPCSTYRAVDYLFPFNITQLGVFQEDFCRLPNDKQWVTADYVAIALFSAIGILTILCTTYDIHHTIILKKDPKKASPLGRSFSVFTNCRRLLTFTSSPGSLDCLDGIRTLAIAWVVVGHTFTVPLTHIPSANPTQLLEWVKHFSSLWITAGPITVDTFFLLSGLLVVYTTAGKLTSSKLLANIHLFYFNRIARMIPLLATGVLLQASLWNHVYDGPYVEGDIERTENCRNNWWAVLLFIQNYVRPTQACLGQTWYICVDMQAYVLSPFVLFWVSRSKREAWVALTAALVSILTAATIYCFIMVFPGGPVIPNRIDDSDYYLVNYYYNTLTRASPFFVGMIFGYILHTYRKKELNISMGLAALFWISAFLLSFWVIFYNYLLRQDDWDNQVVDSLMNSFMRPVWAASVGWLVVACVKGYGGPINWFLSLNMWKLPARISYAMFILHFSLQHMAHSAALRPYYFTVISNLFRFFSEYSISFVIAFFATLLIDAPFSVLLKVLIGGGEARSTKQVEKVKEIENKVTQLPEEENEVVPVVIPKVNVENEKYVKIKL